MRETQHKFHYAWLILIAAACIQGSIIGVMVNSTGVLFSAIIEDMGFRSGDLAIYYTIRALVQAAGCGISSRLFLTKNHKVMMTILATFGLAGYVGMYFYTELWQWYISGFMVGVCMSCVLVVIPIVLNNWFAVKRGMVIGIAMASSGLAGAVFSPILSKLIISFGWRTAAVINGGLAFLLIVLPTIFLLARTPEEKGMKPYGWTEADDARAIAAAGGNGGTAASAGMNVSAAAKKVIMPKSMFVLCAATIITAGIMTQFVNQYTMLARSLGYTIQVGAMVTSFNMVGNVSGKLLIGVMADKLGIFKSVRIVSLIIAAGITIMLFAGLSPILMYLGALLMGLVYSMGTTVPSLVLLDVYGQEEYKTKLARFQSLNCAGMAIASPTLPYIYDFTGSFNGALILGIFCAIASMIGFQVTKKRADAIKAAA